jgi:Prolipoprotein diacylglyceryl transferase
MANEIFIFGLTLFYTFLLAWGFRALPKENWQILASIPNGKKQGNTWEGFNFTYYGFFIAGAYTLGTVIMFVLLGAVHIPLSAIIVISILMAAVCLPASKVVAAVVEKKPHTTTVGGASFVGILSAPWIVWITNRVIGPWVGFEAPVMVVLAALSIAYAFGEGTGRLACISFGCCYGKPLSRCHPFWRGLFNKFYFVFSGKTKKIAYADGLDGVPVVPIQAITSVIFIVVALSGTYLFLQGRPVPAFLVTLMVTQLWRLASEFLRADYRGERRISVYQWMSVAASAYGLLIAYFFRVSETLRVGITTGIHLLWDPAIFIFIQLLWLALFFYTGRSMVTASRISVYVVEDRI